jgi:hypothetical protein
MIPTTGNPTNGTNETFETLLAVTFGSSFTFSIFAFVLYLPLNSGAALTKLVFYSVIVAAGFYVVLKPTIEKKIKESSKPNAAKVLLSLNLVLLPFSVLTFANAKLDGSPMIEYKFPVLSKYIKTTKSSRLHFIEFESPVGATCCFLPDETDSVRISEAEYLDVTAGQTTVNLQIKSGFLNLPWVSSYKLVFPIAPNEVEQKEAANWNPVQNEVKPQEFKTEKWPNGKTKSLEPIFNGKINGVGKYWHPNGQLYGEIPYENGMKHGRFKLFREDGTVDQELSYKNGQLHGRVRWYGENGNLKQESRYFNGKPMEETKKPPGW